MVGTIICYSACVLVILLEITWGWNKPYMYDILLYGILACGVPACGALFSGMLPLCEARHVGVLHSAVMAFNVMYYLVLFVIFIMTVWFSRLLWRRRKMYIYSWNVPGPFCLPIIGMTYMLIGKYDDFINVGVRMVSTYPPFVKFWLGPHLFYSLRDPEDIRKVLTNPKCLEKNFIYKLTAMHIGTGLLTAPVAKWKKHRKLLRPAFTQQVLNSFVEVFVEQANILIKVLQNHTGQKEMDISHYVNAMMMDVVGETAMGLKLNTQGGNTEFLKNFDRVLEIVALQIFKVWYQVEWIWKLSPLSRESEKCSNTFMSIILEVLKKKKQALDREKIQRKGLLTPNNEEGGDVKRQAFLDFIMENPDLTEEEIADEVKVLMLAGIDTTAMGTCYCLELLAMHPEVQLKVYEEIIEVVGEERPVGFSDLPNLKYLDRVLKETLRIFPVIIFFSRTAEEDIDLGHHVIPEGANITFSTMSIHRNPEYWPDPLKFDPDRFLPEEVAKRPVYSYVPFSHGPRNCIGYAYGMMGLKTLAATIIRKYRVFSGYKSVEEIKMKTAIMSRPKNGFKVYVENR